MSANEVNSFIRQHLDKSDSEIARLLNAQGIVASTDMVRGRRRRMGEVKSVSSAERKPQPTGAAVAEPVVAEISPEQENAKDRKIARLEADIQHMRKLYKSQTKQTSGMEELVAAVYELVPTMEPVQPPQPVIMKGDVETESVVLLLGDLHFGEVVDESQTGGISVYNLDIGKRRYDATIERAVRLCKDKLRGGYNLPSLDVFFLGDLISGIIHDELKQNDERGIVEQVIAAVEIIAPGILTLCENFERVHITGVVGNHGRVEEHYYFKGKAINNYDYLIYKMLEKLLAGQPNLTWDIPRSFWAITQVENSTFLVMHGDIIKSWMGMPWYGLSRAYMKLRTLKQDYGMDFQHLVVGHYHNPNIMTLMRYKLFVNGCLKGGDEYSIGAISAACDPVQIMFGVHPKRGITWNFEINTADIR